MGTLWGEALGSGVGRTASSQSQEKLSNSGMVTLVGNEFLITGSKQAEAGSVPAHRLSEGGSRAGLGLYKPKGLLITIESP